ncbi:DNA-binding transcriptional LysR family regulator [Gluconobacter cerinus]|uniref:LysR family transcriptional regulator n=1 Tax=Gluconobacter cerinus TaxID=38307 RepID=UPI001B8B5B19|nr:LysR family transcriptional regulator [Gluconobacter cerinus]MBS0984457.1 LysR family transcriptional regulator [Gluconobacter cerinus]MCW2267064.1 DNA-binding transcriptional LysR family regulator [Gluconobacter cerinus]
MRGSEYAELMAFMAIAQERSFRAAARRLSISPSALSHSLRALEERIGARLLHRTTRSVAPTEAGQALLDRLRPAVAEVDAAVRDVTVSQQRPRGRLRINLPRAAAQLIIMPRLAAFREAYPEISLDLAIDDALTDVIAKGYDAGVRSGAIVDQDMISVPLTPDLRMVVVATPDFLSAHTKLESPADLTGLPCLTYRWLETGVLQPWRFEGPDGAFEVNVKSALTVNDTDILLSAALQGVGLAYLTEGVALPHIEAGALIRVLDLWCKPFIGFHLYFSGRRHMPAAMRAFIDFMKLPVSASPGSRICVSAKPY